MAVTRARTRERFHWRAFVSLLVVLGFVILGTTGIGLYLTPAGRIANWSGWTLAGLTKAQWQAVHMVFGFLFVIAGAFHLAVSTEMGLPVEAAVSRLAQSGITAEPDSTLRDIASRNNRHAPDIVTLLGSPVR